MSKEKKTKGEMLRLTDFISTTPAMISYSPGLAGQFSGMNSLILRSLASPGYMQETKKLDNSTTGSERDLVYHDSGTRYMASNSLGSMVGRGEIQKKNNKKKVIQQTNDGGEEEEEEDQEDEEEEEGEEDEEDDDEEEEEEAEEEERKQKPGKRPFPLSQDELNNLITTYMEKKEENKSTSSKKAKKKKSDFSFSVVN